MANPRKFIEKIALHNQKQAEETAAFEKIMREVSAVATNVKVLLLFTWIFFLSRKISRKLVGINRHCVFVYFSLICLYWISHDFHSKFVNSFMFYHVCLTIDAI